ncbi:MAG: DEAD/DEAH box helicase, partial [Bacteroidetes bacterium]
MTVSPQESFQIVYSLLQHQILGYLFEPFVVQLNADRKLTLKYQSISATNANEFAKGLDNRDFELIKLMDSMQQDAIVHKHNHRKIKPLDFFLKVYDQKHGDKAVQEIIHQDLERKRAEIIEKLQGKLLFEMANDGNPTYKRIIIEKEKVKLLFHFRRNEKSTLYFPTMKYADQKLEFQFKNAMLICNEPAWLLLNGHLYSFEKQVDGNKIRPFLQKNNIIIDHKIEEIYFQKFVAPLIESFDVYAKGFDIKTVRSRPKPHLSFSEMATVSVSNMFSTETNTIDNDKILFEISFNYGDFNFKSISTKDSSVSLEKTEDSYIFYKVYRDLNYEKNILENLLSQGIDLRNGKCVLPKNQAFSWLNEHFEQMQTQDFSIEQSLKNGKKYFLGRSQLNLEIKESLDWFDVYAKVMFGEYEIPFIRLRKMILDKIVEFELPNGEIAVIPEVWFTQYSDIFHLMDKKNDQHLIKKHHLALVHELQDRNFAKVDIDEKLLKLRDFEQIEDVPLPKNFAGELRPYQQAGYNWLQFLQKYEFGGCLADDMGLGKSVQTLVLLQDLKEKGADHASLLIVPTSLIYNWEAEAKKFTPKLKIHTYKGANRYKDTSIFRHFDLVITSYGVARLDFEILEKYYFNYLILDESQIIKNPASAISKSVKKLKAKNRLILTGTPIENSTLDLWSQMSFINPNLLGNESYFVKNFQTPIEKKNDQERLKRLYTIIKPFILRRKKNQVAKDLPEKTEQVLFCEMTESQSSKYEEIKSFYRNQILEHIEQNGLNRSQIFVLQGLTKLRQIANHPKMADSDYEGDAVKIKEAMYKLDSIVQENHKILIFSQFVKHLSIFRQALNDKKIPFAYLDGSTKDRQEQVNEFQTNDKIKVFLISLKAGGVGLNLTAADYVFLLDPWWNPAVEAQAVDRAHRIGQTHNVMIYKFIAKNT